MITIIAACSKNLVIGNDNKLIWNVPGDLKRFKEFTTGNIVVMGRKTYESIGKPLPNRRNILLTRDESLKIEGIEIFNDLEKLTKYIQSIQGKEQDIFIIGGGEIYKEFLPISDKIELTLIDKEFEGDTYFPEIGNEWEEINRESKSCDQFDYHYITYKKKI